MDAIISKLIDQLNSSVFILLFVLALAFYLIFQFGKWSQKFLHHEGKLDTLQGLSDKMMELETKADLIYQNTKPCKMVAAHNPIKLTEDGLDVVNKINTEEMAK